MNVKDSIKQYNEVFGGEPWFGASVLRSLENIPVSFWDRKPKNTSHSISELVYHLIDWRNFVIQKINENEGFSIELNSEQDWRKEVTIQTEKQKIDVLKELIETQNEICEVLGAKSDSWMNKEVTGKQYKNKYMIRGVIQHDVYHLGQINMIYSQLK
ncbi:DinB family protein [Aquimarina sediminis]|uniref:DinB family protein n=1 Tax=Aquimarina sediminis TaxID=2070536 RepID=UPI000CA0533B|nr:DinB family protein [Aquimarina sediminis]